MRENYTERGGFAFVTLGGPLDESLKAVELLAHLPRGARGVVFLIDDVERITSFGVRQALEVFRSIPNGACYLMKARPAIVAQLNSISEFAQHITLISFYCPYLCTNCDKAFEVLVDLRHQRKLIAARQAPPANCPVCGTLAEFDDLEEIYFGRVAAQPPLVLPAGLESALDGAGTSLGIQTFVQSDVTVIWLSGSLLNASKLKRYTSGLEGDVLLMLKGVTDAKPEAAALLCDQLASESIRLYLVGIPIGLLATFVEAFSRRPSTTIISASVRTECGKCLQEQSLSYMAATGENDQRACCHCGAALSPDINRDDMRDLLALPAPNFPGRISALLQRAEAPLLTPPGSAVPAEEAPRQLGKYEIVRRLGFGGMAEVLLAKQAGPEGFQKKVVIKRILPHLLQDANFVSMFLNEARIAARLTDSRIAQIYDLVDDGGRYFMVMEYVQGTDLNRVIRAVTSLQSSVPVQFCARIGAEIFGALSAAHDFADDNGKVQPILHRDVSPHNVLIGVDGRVKLADFGIAKAADSSELTNSGALKGKALYMAPELIQGEPFDARCDIFAAGLVLYFLMTLNHPFREANELLVIQKVLREVIPDVGSVRSDCPPRLAEIIMKALERDQMKRYQSARQVTLDLEEFLGQSGKPASHSHLSDWLAQLIEKSPLVAADPPLPAWELHSTALAVDQGDTDGVTPKIVGRINE